MKSSISLFIIFAVVSLSIAESSFSSLKSLDDNAEGKGLVKLSFGDEFITESINNLMSSVYDDIAKSIPSLPSVTETLKIAGIGLASFTVSNFNLTSLEYHNNDIVVVLPYENNKIHAHIRNIKTSLTASYTQKVGLIKSKAKSIKLTVEGEAEIDIAVVFHDGIHSLHIIDFSVSHKLDDLVIKGHPLISLILKKGLFKKTIDSSISSNVKASANAKLDDLFKSLIEKGVNIPMLPHHVAKLYLLPNIIYTNTGVEFSFNADVQPKETLSSELFVLSSSENKHIKLSLSNDLLNNFIKAAYEENLFTFDLSDQTVTFPVPFKFNTYYFSKLIPCIYNNWPNKDLIIRIKAISSPIIKLSNTNSLSLTTKLSYDYLLAEDPNVIMVGFSSNVYMSLNLSSGEDKTKVYFELVSTTLSSTVVTTKCGLTNGMIFEKAFNIISNILILTINQQFLSKGIAIPKIDHINLNGIELTTKDDNFITDLDLDIN